MYYDTQTNTKLNFLRQVREARPNVSIPANVTDETLAEIGILSVVENKPTPTEYQTIHPLALEMIDGVPTLNYVVHDIPEDEVLEMKRATVSTAIQKLLDDKAKEYGYDSIISACSYVGSTNFGAEGQAFLDWRDATWTKVHQVEADVVSGARTEPTLEELVLELPACTGV